MGFGWAVSGPAHRDPEYPSPDNLTIVSLDLRPGAYTQHYYDSRRVVRLYAMVLADLVWTQTP
jgi:hypothetical protein